VFRRWWVPRLAGVRSRLAVLAAATHANELVAAVAACNLRLGSCTAMTKLRIVILGFGTARLKIVLERWTNPKPLQPIWDRAAI
jgi:hypothetical protein